MTDKPVATKLCNLLVPEAQPDLGLYSVAAQALGGPAPSESSMNAILEGFRSSYGGLWVGGTACLTAHSLSFSPNALNRAVHQGDYSLSIPLSEITAVAWEFGFVSGILRLTTHRGVVKLRCFGAKGFGAVLERQIAMATRSA